MSATIHSLPGSQSLEPLKTEPEDGNLPNPPAPEPSDTDKPLRLLPDNWLQPLIPIFINLMLPMVIAQLAYSGTPGADPRWFAVTAVLPALWVAAPSRWWGGLTLAGYMLTVGRGIPPSAAAFYGDPSAYWFGALLLSVVVAAPFAMGALFWAKTPIIRLVMIPVWLLAWAFNPIGFGNPLQAAGWIFPGEGAWGLLGLVVLMLMISIRWWSFLIIPLLVLLYPPPQQTTPAMIPVWHEHNTQYRFGVGMEKHPDRMAEYQRHQANLSLTRTQGDGIHLFPETVGGLWNPGAQQLWQSGLQDAKTAILGAYVPSANGLTNTVLEITQNGTRTVYQQRLPVPVVMWRPWERSNPTSFTANTNNGVATVAGRQTAFLLCYETLLAGPILQSLLRAKTVQQIVSLSSVWWSPAYIKDAQANAVKAWGSLYGIPVHMAFN